MTNEMFSLNGRNYKAKEIDFNFVCELGLNGIDITEIQTKIMGAIRVYIAYCMGTDVMTAGDEINLHIINGGTLELEMGPRPCHEWGTSPQAAPPSFDM